MAKYMLITILIFLLHTNTALSSNPENTDKPVREFAYNSLKLVLTYSLEKNLSGDSAGEIADPSGLIILLAEMDTVEARSLLLQMLEVYLGRIHTEALDYAIVKQGKKIRTELKALLTKPVQCSFLKNELNGAKPNKLKCLSREDRDKYIRYLLDTIDQGKKIEYVL